MKTIKEHAVVIVAGGSGLRIGADIPKQFLLLAEKPMLMHTIEKFHDFDNNMQIVVVLHQDYFDYWKELCKEYRFDVHCELVEGGATRFESVKNGLSVVTDQSIVAIHDAARPFVSKKLIEQCYYNVQELQCGVIPVVDEKNSLRQVVNGIHKPLNREGVKIVQTPQVFPAHIIKKAYEVEFNPQFTDDASVAEAAGCFVKLIEGDDANIKITTITDLNIASFLFQARK